MHTHSAKLLPWHLSYIEYYLVSTKPMSIYNDHIYDVHVYNLERTTADGIVLEQGWQYVDVIDIFPLDLLTFSYKMSSLS